MPALIYEKKGRVGYLTLNRPEQRNAINNEMLELMYDALLDVRDNPDVWVGVIKANGPAFSSGHDLKEMRDRARRTVTAYDIYSLLLKIPKPMIAAINGACLAQGAGIALNCDIQIAADTAFFGWPQVKRGIASVSGPTILARRIPLNKAFEILFLGQFLDAHKAAELSLINKVVPADQLEATVQEYVDGILENAPLSMRAIKESSLLTRDMPQDAAFQVATRYINEINNTNDAKEGLRAFAEKRKPQWTGT